MLRNLFISSYRFFIKNKTSSLINIFGLSVGLASCILIFVYISFELSFDNYHSNKNNIYRVVRHNLSNSGEEYNDETEYPLGEFLRLSFPDIETIARTHLSEERIVRVENESYLEDNLLFAEPDIFKIFDFNWIEGKKESALNDKHSVVLTKSLCEKYFKDSSPIGKIISLENGINLKVSGIVEDAPQNTHLPFSIIINIDALNEEFIGFNYDRWSVILSDFCVYLLLNDSYNLSNLENQITEKVRTHLEANENDVYSYHLQSLSDIHYDIQYNGVVYTSSRKIIWVFALIGLFILVIANINFINLSIAQSIKKSKEVGIRKVIGAYRSLLIRRFLIEAYLITTVAVIIAVVLAEISLPLLNRYLGNNIQFNLYSNSGIVLFVLILLFITGLSTGLYPAFVLSSYKPLDAIKNKISSHKRSVKYLRNSLIVIQFVVSQVLIIGTIIISLQMNFIQNKDLGFESDSIIKFSVPDQEKADVLKSKLLENSNIFSFTQGISSPMAGDDERFTSGLYTIEMGRENSIDCEVKTCDEDYLKTFKMKMVAGEWDILRRTADSLRKIVVNETLCKMLGFETNLDAVGVRINYGRIVGVIEDFHSESFHETMEPVVFFYYPRFFGMGYAKVNPKNMPQAIEHIESVWNDLFPEQYFDYEILDDYLESLYNKDKQMSQIIRFFSIIAIILACLGLFGLISYVVVQKTPEIGIRKVLGASYKNLISQISNEYIKLIIISNLIAWPVSWYFIENWLNQFAFRINFPWYVLIIAFVISIILALFTISFQTIKAIRINPVESLKYE
jgi:putative ABC transport system permease protein